jgi:hypothetical protein
MVTRLNKSELIFVVKTVSIFLTPSQILYEFNMKLYTFNHHHHHHHHHVHEGLGVFPHPQDEVGPSISFSVVLCSFVLWFIL